MSRRAGVALLAAASIVLLLALGTFATPVPADGAGPADAPRGHQNDLPVVARLRVSGGQVAQHAPPAPALLVLAVAALVLLAPWAAVRRPRSGELVPIGSGARTRPPHRGPPVLLAG